ncbi:hypothetical protein ACFQL1_11140 [Halomicroarcula sp. GCM10025709]|uniref:hypothetical protein n=1 Tax=Haloarcula TaxID=2237 RepID=UPI0024C296E2|nr:hypothetical protein [Halomicroarcula sp. YJ-61-S]
MLRRLRENGPVVLVPLAWTFALAAHVDVLALRTVLIAHLVMDTVIVVFTALSWREMTSGVLRAWKLVLLAGLVATLVGTAGLLATPPIRPALTATVVAWMLIPAAGLAYTGQHVDRLASIYTVGAALSVVGAGVYVAGVASVGPLLVPAGLALTGVGQTAGIVAAVVGY